MNGSATIFAASGPLLVPDQRKAGGAFLRARPGIYSYAVDRNRKARATVFDALWVWKSSKRENPAGR